MLQGDGEALLFRSLWKGVWRPSKAVIVCDPTWPNRNNAWCVQLDYIRFIRRVFKTTAQQGKQKKAQTRWWYGWKQVYDIGLLKHMKSLPEDSVSTVFSNTFNSFHIWELNGYLIEKWSMFQYRMSSTGTWVQSSKYILEKVWWQPRWKDTATQAVHLEKKQIQSCAPWEKQIQWTESSLENPIM